MSITNIYHLKALNIKGEEVSLEKYKGKVLLIVNTATECGFTPQLNELEELYEEFKDHNFVVLGFPSNDFGNQEPRKEDEIQSFCQVNYGVSFPMFSKVKVKGSDAHSLFKFLSDRVQNGKVSSKPLWNFHKYLVDKEGHVVDYFLPVTKPMNARVKKRIRALLSL
ncbi:glutathione peroxidase [Solitalea lacus]|uniref:glutathione peroxidase n=1 Tax=Solitalea lacus TaxID=2911172 RepID=UPI001EDC6A2F|nr:redoxin domain-containing protein [Solitalea lacus]UKJ06522.1 redoxin domain-containing protein [Solitalea lacus]